MIKKVFTILLVFLFPVIGNAQIVPPPAPPPPPPGLPIDGFVCGFSVIAIMYGLYKIHKDSSS